MAGGAQDDDEIITAINVTPLVDVVLVLLIILMVTATAIVSQTIPMELPEADTSETPAPTDRTLAISIDSSGAIFLDANEVDEATLRERVRAARRESEDVKAVIAADGSVQHRSVVRIIDLLRSEEVNKFAINVRPSELQ